MQRKHATQMSFTERRHIQNILKGIRKDIRNVVLSRHALEAMENDHVERVSVEEVVKTILGGKVFEVNNRGGLRVCLRHTTSETCDTIVVIDVVRKAVVTVWKNKTTDQHATIDMRQYRWNVNLVELAV